MAGFTIKPATWAITLGTGLLIWAAAVYGLWLFMGAVA